MCNLTAPMSIQLGATANTMHPFIYTTYIIQIMSLLEFYEHHFVKSLCVALTLGKAIQGLTLSAAAALTCSGNTTTG